MTQPLKFYRIVKHRFSNNEAIYDSQLFPFHQKGLEQAKAWLVLIKSLDREVKDGTAQLDIAVTGKMIKNYTVKSLA